MDLRPCDVAQWHRLFIHSNVNDFTAACRLCGVANVYFTVSMESHHREYAVSSFPVCPDCMVGIVVVATELTACGEPSCGTICMELHTSVPERLLSRLSQTCSDSEIGGDTASAIALNKGECPVCHGNQRGFPPWFSEFVEKKVVAGAESMADEPQRAYLEVDGCQVSYGFVPYHNKHHAEISSVFETHRVAVSSLRYVIFRAFTRRGIPLKNVSIVDAIRHASKALVAPTLTGVGLPSKLHAVPVTWASPRINGVRVKAAVVVDIEVRAHDGYALFSGSDSPLFDVSIKQPSAFLSSYVEQDDWPACLMPFARVSALK